jgi:hypothetical protein
MQLIYPMDQEGSLMPQMTNKSYYSDASAETLLEIYSSGPARFRQAISGLPDSQMQAHPIDGKWSIKEIAFHLVDSETVAAVRIRQAITQSDRDLAFYDQDIWARDLNYQVMSDQQLAAQLDLFDSLRKSATLLFKTLPHDAWQNAGMHRRRGEMTVREMLGLYTGHCEKHIQQILERRRLLGNPLEMKPLLEIF